MIGLLQVGLGAWGRDWATRIVPQVPQAKIVGCVDVSPAALREVVRLGLVAEACCFESLDEALGRVDAQAVLVTTDLPGHVPAVMAGLRSGKHVIVEKPFAPSLEQARAAVRLAASRGVTLMVSQNYRFFPAVRLAQQVVGSGRLGNLLHITLDFRRFSSPSPEGPRGHRGWAQPLLLDMSIHHFDLLRAVTGRDAVAVDCRTWNPVWAGFRDPPEGVATIELSGDVIVSYRGSWVCPARPTPWAGEWRMEFDDGELWWTSRRDLEDTSDDTASIYDHTGRHSVLDLPAPGRVDRAGALAAFVAAIAAGAEPEASGRDNVASLALTYAAIDSARRGRRIRIRTS